MSLPIQRITETSRPALTAHFLALPPEDVRLRFGTPRAPESIATYTEQIDFDRDAVFGVFDDELRLAGVAHLAFGDDMAELGVSVLPGHRGRGIGSALFGRAAEHARNRFVTRMFMHCLSENAAMMHIAKKSGMTICVDTGEADAFLKLPPADPASVAGEFVEQRLALFDYALKAQVATLKRVTTALGGGASEAAENGSAAGGSPKSNDAAG